MLAETDRSSLSDARRCLPALALALCVVDLGCSRLRSSRRDEPPRMLGTIRPGRDSYADLHRSPTPAVATAEATIADPLDAPTGPARALASGTAPARESSATAPVNLLPPVDGEPRATPRLASSAVAASVPNGSRLIASAERRPDASSRSAEAARVVAEARASLDRMATYRVALHRQERVNGALLPEEDVVLAIRREPRAVRLTWPSGPHRGREVLYRGDEPGGLMHVNMADSAIPVPRLSIPPDSPMVMRNSRHPVTEAGFEPILASLEAAIRAPGAAGLTYAGMDTPALLDRPHHSLVRTTPSGERWRAFIDPANHLPALVECEAANGDLLERYRFRDVEADPADLGSAAAFDPDARWGPPRGLFGRLGRGNDAATPR